MRRPFLQFPGATAAVRSALAALTFTAAFAWAVVPAAAFAGVETIHLAWEDCRGGPAAADNASFTCVSNSEVLQLVAGFTLAQPLDSLIAVEVVVDLQHEDAVLPQWWHLEAGGCRTGALSASADLSALSCFPTWGQAGTGLVQDYAVGQPRGGANQARIRAVVAVPSDSARALSGLDTYGAIVLILDSRKTVNPGFCQGCDRPACLVLNSILLRRLPGGTGDVYLQTPAAGNGNWVTWAGGATSGCLAVPARAVTWGQIKSLYR